jgi:hypothetical protein
MTRPEFCSVLRRNWLHVLGFAALVVLSATLHEWVLQPMVDEQTSSEYRLCRLDLVSVAGQRKLSVRMACVPTLEILDDDDVDQPTIEQTLTAARTTTTTTTTLPPCRVEASDPDMPEIKSVDDWLRGTSAFGTSGAGGRHAYPCHGGRAPYGVCALQTDVVHSLSPSLAGKYIRIAGNHDTKERARTLDNVSQHGRWVTTQHSRAWMTVHARLKLHNLTARDPVSEWAVWTDANFPTCYTRACEAKLRDRVTRFESSGNGDGNDGEPCWYMRSHNTLYTEPPHTIDIWITQLSIGVLLFTAIGIGVHAAITTL